MALKKGRSIQSSIYISMHLQTSIDCNAACALKFSLPLTQRCRNTPHSAQATPVKITTNANNDGTSPITTNARLRRRQSLTGLPPPSSTMSRRSSLGGKSDSSKYLDKENAVLLLLRVLNMQRWRLPCAEE